MQKKNEVEILFTKKQLTYLLLALKSYEVSVSKAFEKDEDVGDAHVDLLVIESITRLIKKAHKDFE